MRRNAIVIVSDENILPAAEFLWVRLQGLNKRQDTDVVLVSPKRRHAIDGIKVDDRSHIDLNSVHLPEGDLPTFGHITRAAFVRIALPRLVRHRYKRLLYLDVDVYPLDSRVFDVFDVDFQGKPVGAVRDLVAQFSPESLVNLDVANYFNSGVICFDTDAYVDGDLDHATFSFCISHKSLIKFADQCALNLALDNRWYELSVDFNFPVRLVGTEAERYSSPSLLHFLSVVKLWSTPTYQGVLKYKIELALFLFRERRLRFLVKNIQKRYLFKWVKRHLKKSLGIPNQGLLDGPPKWASDENGPLIKYLSSLRPH